MSVEYYIVCNKHKEYVHVCSDGGRGPLLQCDRSLAAFLITHRHCDLNVINEDEEEELESYKEWDLENWRESLRYDLDEEK